MPWEERPSWSMRKISSYRGWLLFGRTPVPLTKKSRGERVASPLAPKEEEQQKRWRKMSPRRHRQTPTPYEPLEGVVTPIPSPAGGSPAACQAPLPIERMQISLASSPKKLEEPEESPQEVEARMREEERSVPPKPETMLTTKAMDVEKRTKKWLHDEGSPQIHHLKCPPESLKSRE